MALCCNNKSKWYLRNVMNLPEDKIATLLNDTYNAHVSVGTVVDYSRRLLNFRR